MKRSIFYLSFVFVLFLSLSGISDTLVLKDGRVLQGTFKGGDVTAIQFEVNGVIEIVTISDITSLTFAPRAAREAESRPPAAAAGVVQPAGDTGQASATVTVPAGTRMMLKLDNNVSTATHKEGTAVTAVLENDLVANGVVVAPKGTRVYGKVVESVGGRRIGNQRIVMTFTDISLNNQLVPIKTGVVGAEGGRGGTVRKVGAGALIGAGIDGSSGAGKGALIGAGVAVLAGGDHIQVPAGTLVEINLEQPLTVTR